MSEISYLKRVEVRVQDLKVGMYVGALDKPWESSSFLFQGFPIESERQIEQLKRECRKVYVDIKTKEELALHNLQVGCELEISDSSRNSVDRKALSSKAFKPSSQSSNNLTDELPSALAAFKSTQERLLKIHNQALANQVIDVEPLRHTVDDMIVSLKNRPEALLLLLNVKHKESYTTEHQLRVSILALGFGIFLGMSNEQLKTLGLAGLLYDIGKARMPSLVLNKPAKITREDALILQHHPEESYRILSKVPSLSEVVKEVALSHHERIDGKGYPRHIHKDRVSRYAKVISIIDCYDAIISNRAYSKAKTATDAMKVLQDNSGDKFDRFLVEKFVEWLTPYPVGSIVELKSGEVAIVLNVSHQSPSKPKLLIVSDKVHHTNKQTILDLSQDPTHSKGTKYEVWNLIVDGTYGIELKSFLDKDSLGVSIWNKSAKKDSPFHEFL